MKLRSILPLLFATSMASAQNTPDAALRRMADGWNRHDLRAVAAEVYGANPRVDPTRAAANLGPEPWPKIAILNVQTRSDRGMATLTYTFKVNDLRHPMTQRETIVARLVGGQWKMVPVAPTQGIKSSMGNLGYIVTHPEGRIFGPSTSESTEALSKIKQLALGCLMIAGDHDDRFAFTPGNAKRVLRPYLKNEELWTAPGDPKGTMSFSINQAVAGKRMVDIAEPANTVLLYEGKAGKLSFRHNGRAAVAFADGHAKLFRPEDAKKLRWKP